MSWFHTLVGMTVKTGWPTAPSVTKAPLPLPDNVQFFSMAEACQALHFDMELKDLDIPLIKKGCEIIKAPYIGGGKFWTKKTGNCAEEEEDIKQCIAKELWRGTHAIVVFQRLERNHPRYVYYQAIAIRSDDLIDLKKAMKIHKLKAFL